MIGKILAPDGDWFDEFGWSVAVSEDRVVVGAPRNDNENGDDAGAVYVFTTSGEFVEKLVAPDSHTTKYFGRDVSNFGNTLIVGAPEDDDNSEISGSAYMYLI